MTDISAGDEVTVTITGTVTDDVMLSGTFDLRTSDGQLYDYITEGPDVKVTVLRPDRPTRREVLEQHQHDAEFERCDCGVEIWTRRLFAHHLEAVLTKWEES